MQMSTQHYDAPIPEELFSYFGIKLPSVLGARGQTVSKPRMLLKSCFNQRQQYSTPTALFERLGAYHHPFQPGPI
jgi:hypothetical protein